MIADLLFALSLIAAWFLLGSIVTWALCPVLARRSAELERVISRHPAGSRWEP